MATVNVYLPDDLAAEVKAAELNVSKVAQAALRTELNRGRMCEWLDDLKKLPPLKDPITHDQVMQAMDEAREELWGR